MRVSVCGLCQRRYVCACDRCVCACAVCVCACACQRRYVCLVRLRESASVCQSAL